MTLSNFHANGNVQDGELLHRSDGFIKNFVASFRQSAANGNFSIGILKLKDADLNRLHGIVSEIDSRRLFFACGDDEIPRQAMRSLYEVRTSIRQQSKGVWANPSCEILVQEISHVLGQSCTEAERLGGEDIHMGGENFDAFLDVITNMRLKVWGLVGILKKKVGSVINPRNMPTEIQNKTQDVDL